MPCPVCHKPVKDGAAVCPHCDAVLDESILGAMPDDDEAEDTPTKAAAKKPARRPAPISVAKPAPGTPVYTNKYSQYWTEDAPSPSAAPAKEARSAELPAARSDAEPTTTGDPLKDVGKLWSGFLALHFEDKLTAVSAALLVLAAILPWRSTLDEGDEMGLLTWGFGPPGWARWPSRRSGCARPASWPRCRAA